MNNQEIRREMKKHNIWQWEVADGMGISEFTFTRWLRKELSDERKAVVLNTIVQLVAQKGACADIRRIEP